LDAVVISFWRFDNGFGIPVSTLFAPNDRARLGPEFGTARASMNPEWQRYFATSAF
jgi:hypothetical protein